MGQSRPCSNFSESSKAVLNVDFYYDTVSPYSWPAFEVICRYRDRWNLQVNWKPIFLGGLVNSVGNPYLNAMMSCPNKSRYGFMDLERRTASFFDIPFKMKEDPFTLIGVVGSLNQQRFITAVNQLPEMTESVSRNFWLRSWSDDKDVHTTQDIATVAKAAGLKEDQVQLCLEAVKTNAIKHKLKEITEEAGERGAFGAPTMFFQDNHGGEEEMFWGSDRFDMIAAIYGKKWLGPNPDRAAKK